MIKYLFLSTVFILSGWFGKEKRVDYIEVSIIEAWIGYIHEC
jgi:hypothetical protein